MVNDQDAMSPSMMTQSSCSIMAARPPPDVQLRATMAV
jgi:hypothetical protein